MQADSAHEGQSVSKAWVVRHHREFSARLNPVRELQASVIEPYSLSFSLWLAATVPNGGYRRAVSATDRGRSRN